MQKTKFSKINDQLNNLLIGFLSSSWKSKSINIEIILIDFDFQVELKKPNNNLLN